MSTKREQILEALKTKLSAVTQATGGIYRSRLYALARGETPAIIVEPVNDNAEVDMLGVIDWTMLVRIAVVSRGSIQSDTPPDQVADDVVNAVHSQLVSDRSLGGLTMDIEPVSATFELQPGDQPVGVISLGYQVKYRTSAGDLSS